MSIVLDRLYAVHTRMLERVIKDEPLVITRSEVSALVDHMMPLFRIAPERESLADAIMHGRAELWGHQIVTLK